LANERKKYTSCRGTTSLSYFKKLLEKASEKEMRYFFDMLITAQVYHVKITMLKITPLAQVLYGTYFLFPTSLSSLLIFHS